MKDQQKFDCLQIEELATGDFIRRQSNLIFVAQIAGKLALGGIFAATLNNVRNRGCKCLVPCAKVHIYCAEKSFVRENVDDTRAQEKQNVFWLCLTKNAKSLVAQGR